ncbi:WD repeat and coiled-coil-containing protein-like isoform X2 [Physella acuta]|uniref:WD repeat and coiled-coil-containing protein-like isoform X2 n=1 Tax=Physella acuta TaxID=109671 RepID=UPI0027DD2B19|nr:WD repeat and coiled-coil-containing protein-like isoform X2 [Physella acuta]
MELGKGKLRKVGVNNLFSAYHPKHGIVWTDGQRIYLTPIQIETDHLKNGTSIQLFEFDNVLSVHWSAVSKSCYLCIVHTLHVTIWAVGGSWPQFSMNQFRKINHQAIPAGCLWNPCEDILCILHKQQCNLYYQQESFSFPVLQRGKYLCGCWSSDGKKLYLSTGSSLLIYQWQDLKLMDQFTSSTWESPELKAEIISVIPVMENAILFTAQVSLESLICTPEMFSETSSSFESSLFNMSSQTVRKLTSMLMLVPDSGGEPISVSLQGILNPDIIIYEHWSRCIVVGSNTQSVMQIFTLVKDKLIQCGNINLENNERLKGLCTHLLTPGILVLIGEKDGADIFDIATQSQFSLTLKYFSLKDYSNIASDSQDTAEPVKFECPNYLIKSISFSSNSLLRDELTLPGESLGCRNISSLIQELDHQPVNPQLETVSFSSQAPVFNNTKLLSLFELSAKTSSDQLLDTTSCMSHHVLQPVTAEVKSGEQVTSHVLGKDNAKANVKPKVHTTDVKSNKEKPDALAQQLQFQELSLLALQKQLQELSQCVKQTCLILPSKYQDFKRPELVEIYCTKAGATERKRFLLDDGRLHLDTIKTAFNLSSVEILLDGEYCVVSANTDGYIPMKFSAAQELQISGF